MGQKIILKREPCLVSKHMALSYQAEAVDAVKDLEYAGIFHEQGLGKSKIAIDLILYWLENKVVDTVLYVAKKSLLHNCEREFLMHTFIKPTVLSQDKKTNFHIFNSPSRLMLAHYEVLKTEKERLKLFLKTRNVAIILDESAKIKNPESSLTKAVFELAPLFKKRVIMTGTPVANRPYDIWAQIYFLDQGKSLGEDFSRFKQLAELDPDFKDRAFEREEFEKFINELFSKIKSFCVRETKNSGIIELPDKKYQIIQVDWEKSQYDLYRQIQKDTRAIVMKNGLPTEDNADVVLKRLLRLVQIASNPRLVDEGYKKEPGKLVLLKDLVRRVCNNNEKCIVWTSFTANVDWLKEELQRFGSCKVHGKIKIERRNKSIARFLTKDDVRVLVATPGAAKEGLTLTVANHVIFFDRIFSLDDYLQAQDRIHRISQKKTCYVYNLIMKESIDEWVDALIEAKHLAAQLAQGDISLDYYKSKVSYEFGEILKGILQENKK